MYVVAREFKANGRIYRPGEPCPEAATWPTLRSLLAMGWIKRAPVEASASPGPEVSPAEEQAQVEALASEPEEQHEPEEPPMEQALAPDSDGKEGHGKGGRRKRRG